MKNYFSLSMQPREINQISALGLAHCGDAVFELLVRSWLCDSGKLTTKQLHRATVSYVCAPAQAARADRMLPLLTEDELAQYKRGRNAKKGTKAKHASVAQYNKSTGFEALLGYLYVTGNYERLNYLLNYEGDGNNETLSSEDLYNEN